MTRRPPRRATSAPTSRVAPGPNLIADVSMVKRISRIGCGSATDPPVISSRRAPSTASIFALEPPGDAVVAAVANQLIAAMSTALAFRQGRPTRSSLEDLGQPRFTRPELPPCCRLRSCCRRRSCAGGPGPFRRYLSPQRHPPRPCQSTRPPARRLTPDPWRWSTSHRSWLLRPWRHRTLHPTDPPRLSRRHLAPPEPNRPVVAAATRSGYRGRSTPSGHKQSRHREYQGPRATRHSRATAPLPNPPRYPWRRLRLRCRR